MPILTPRLRIQPRQIGEGPILNHAICSSLEHLSPWLPFAKTAPTLEESEEHCRRAYAQFILRENFTLSMYSRKEGSLVGSTGLHRPNWEVPSFEIGFWICREFEGQGYITESTNALTQYAFGALKAKRVEIRCDARNTRSLAVMLRLGFVQEGILRNDAVQQTGELRDTIVTARYDSEGLPKLEVTWGMTEES